MTKSVETQETMAELINTSIPGPAHKVLDDLVGSWTTEARGWFKAGEEPMVSTGKSTMAWVLDGRFLKQDHEGDMQGVGYLGYDNVKQSYVSVWLDNFSTAIAQSSEGKYDAATKTITDSGSYSWPTTPSKQMEFRSEWKFVHRDKVIYSVFNKDPEGREFKHLEMTYQRIP